jgi:hypothetical protein
LRKRALRWEEQKIYVIRVKSAREDSGKGREETYGKYKGLASTQDWNLRFLDLDFNLYTTVSDLQSIFL